MSDIPGYDYGKVARSPVTLEELEELKRSVGFDEETRAGLTMAGKVLQDQTREIVFHWRGQIVASIPNLIRHSRDLDGAALPDYTARSGLRFEQWILDTCQRPYDQDWLDYQEEIALRHTAAKKNATDGVASTSHVPLRDILAFISVINETIRPYLEKHGHSHEDVNRMHSAWCKSMQLQMALWARPYSGQEW